MTMTIRKIIIAMVVMWFGMALFAGQSVTFLKDGRSFTGTIIDISSNTGVVDYQGGTKFHRSEIWMINYEGGDWDFPDERDELAAGVDTVFLRNGQVQSGKIVDFSSRRFVYEFQGGGEVNESAVARIYFCCDVLPAAYSEED